MEHRHGGKVAFITGAGAGNGRGIARRLAAEGASVACVDINLPGVQETVELVAAAGGQGLALEADVRNRTMVEQALAKTLERFGKVDYLVNNAGVVTMTGFRELTEAEWDWVLDVNLKGYFIVAQVVSQAIAENGGGAIVNISTVEDDVIVSSTGHCQVHYNASKGGVRLLTMALAAELAADNIRVNAVAPGPIDTQFTGRDLKEIPEAMEFITSRALVKRLGTPEDVAAAVSFLLSDDASYITGARLPVDGGWSVR
jgi:glucose 1-dehydrogenase/3-oxoacyl-[acyl-carrier protein] reductase